MAKLSTKARKALPKDEFAGPDRSFPIPNKSHARAALRDAPRAVKAGSITPGEEKSIDRKAEAKLGKGGEHPRSGAKDGLGHGKGGLAVHSSAKATNMHTDGMMRDERY